jgi:LPXTG-motif cell wall-anchored protein
MTTTKKLEKEHYGFIGIALLAIVLVLAALIPTITSGANPTIRQGTTTTYGVLAATTVTNTGATTISGSAGGDVGLSPGTSYTGSASVTRTGVDHITDGAAAIAQTDLVTAYNDLLVPTPTTLAAPDLAGQILVPGSYTITAGTFGNSGNLTLDAGGDASAVFIFQAPSDVVTSPSSTMTLANGAQACNVYWQVTSSATIGTNSTFVGHIYALTSITANTGATIYGQLLARNGAVTLDNNTIVNNACATATPAPVATQASIPSPPQDSEITFVTTADCTTTEDYWVYLVGNFPSPVTNIAVNAVNIPANRWTQTISQVGIRIPASDQKTFTIDVYNGRTPMLATQVFTCLTPEVRETASPTPTPTVEETETVTETGGELPKTGTDSYTYLLIGAALVALGAGGFVLRKRVTK